MTPEELAASGVRTFDYEAYLGHMEAYVCSTLPPDADETTRRHHAAGPLNLQRVRRIGRTYTPSAAMQQALQTAHGTTFWLVLSEPWCGDSAQCLPLIAAIAALDPRVALRIALRDENPALRDAYLTKGTRGIPKLVGFANGGEEVFRWGPRPAEGQRLFDEGKREGLERDKNLERLHLWYGRNRGEALEAELIALLVQRGESASTSPTGTPRQSAI
jgi:hypothetical protein